MKIKGVALTPGISRNGRYYSPAMIRQAVEQAQPRVAAGRMLMKAFHDASDTLGYVGRLTSLRVAEDGSAQFEGELADTSTARDVGALIRGKRPFVDGVSIAGEWVGPTRHVKVAGQNCETADGIRLHSVDFTANPGVEGARVVAESLLAGTRVIFEQAAGPVVPVAEEPTVRQLAGLTTEESDRVRAELLAGTFAALDARRARTGPSPFWRGLDKTI